MLPSNQRLTRLQVTEFLKNTDIKVVFNRLGTLKYVPSPIIGFSVVTGSKNQKKAVLRNKARRQIYTLFNKHKDIFPMTGMLYVSKQLYDFSYAEMEGYFNELVKKTQKNT